MRFVLATFADAIVSSSWPFSFSRLNGFDLSRLSFEDLKKEDDDDPVDCNWIGGRCGCQPAEGAVDEPDLEDLVGDATADPGGEPSCSASSSVSLITLD